MKVKTTEELITLIELTLKKQNGEVVERALSELGLSAAALELKKRDLTNNQISFLNEITSNTFSSLGENDILKLWEIKTKSSKKFSISKMNVRFIVFFVLAIGLPFYYKLIIFGSFDPKLPSQQMVTKSTKQANTICEGDESCISKVRDNYTSSGKIILGEEYLGNGIFGISFLDPSKGEDFNSQVKTDCNCTIINVQLEPMK